ncbi:hypothetical protein YEY1_19955 [Yersinia enterocolitica subsp. palearctica]|nr:hypothetical protein [Yersinia enterocolitica]QBQ00814.1 hypothetical protein YEY1_19955 [Yersinia enterocolitica subsp. palearctica]
MAAIPERYFQEKTLGLLGASIYGAARAYRDVLTASLRSACSLRSRHFVNYLKPRKGGASIYSRMIKATRHSAAV